ncbi:peroxide stress protein YaaA [Cryobacterium sp. SO2]|uniref:YaaA family protein n=1 Tax=Cryobacterium sp. SO2 TaxID=1897060 RepID=UPI00223DCFCB|nr:peroxide stress protein YaaA [Cryobacterium sp. SO2]WEO78335.1 peroxide stress protein YaaA [Cryobacterium sp. SO2]
MFVLLPPSETKRSGGGFASLDIDSLVFPALNRRRRTVVRALKSLAKDQDATVRALKLGRTQLAEVERNATVASSPTTPVIDRYTGVLYDALDAATLSPDARAFAGRHLLVHSALLGPVGGLDLVPAYRLSHDSRLPELPLKKHWATDVSAVLESSGGLLLDLRSEGYVSLGAAAAHPARYFLRVVTETADGQTRALNHFNKKSKGEFTRALLTNGQDFGTVEELLGWAPTAGLTLRPGATGELQLVVTGHA